MTQAVIQTERTPDALPRTSKPAALIGGATRAARLSLDAAKAAGFDDPALRAALLAAVERMSALAARRLSPPAAQTSTARVTTPDECLAALKQPGVAEVEVPFSILDPRWRTAEMRAALTARGETRIHTYGTFLGGLLTYGQAANWPKVEGLNPAFVIETLDVLTTALGRQSRADLCLAYVRAQDFIDGVIIGTDDPKEWDCYARLATKQPLTAPQCATVEDILPDLPVAILDPRLWP